MHAWPRAALLAVLAPGCVAENPADPGDTDTDTDTGSDTTPMVDPGSIVGCPEGESCVLVFAAQSYDDRVEVFAPDDPNNAYRGAIDLDVRPGRDNELLDEPVGLALGEAFLHVSLGHYPNREQGTLVSLPRTMLGSHPAGTTVPASDILLAGVFQPPVVATPFAVLEPIFVHHQPMLGRLVIGTFNNDVAVTEDMWTQPGLLQIVDTADPTQFTTAELGALNGDCLAAAQVISMEDEESIAVACDGNEAIAFVELGPGLPETIEGKVCPLPTEPGHRVRHLAYDGEDRVLVTYGPGFATGTTAGRVYVMRRSNCVATPIDLGQNGEAHPGQIVRVGDAFLVASGAPADTTSKRGIFVVQADGTLCPDPVPGFDAHWTSNVGPTPIQPFALAVSPDGTHLAVGAAVNAVRSAVGSTELVFGKVLWATLANVEDPCAMSATVVDLTDGAPGHAPLSNPADPTTYRQQTYTVAVYEVQG